MKRDLRTNRTYMPPHPEILPIPGMDRLLRSDRAKGWTTCYPAWNLQYYTCLASLSWTEPNILVETGTNTGCSAALLAQTLRETGLPGHLYTFERDEQLCDQAEALFKELGLSDRITVIRGNTQYTLAHWVTEHEKVRFAFVDSGHATNHCLGEAELLLPLVKAAEGKMYFDNTDCGPVDVAICELKKRHGLAGWVDFPNCSGCPNGQAIWQPVQRTEPVEFYNSKTR